MAIAKPLRCIVMGAAGRDFHDFLVFFRERAEFRVVAFTAAQIPFIERRSFPRELAGPLYTSDIPIHPESELAELIAKLEVDLVFLAYSDLAHEAVMHKVSIAQACGAGFAMLGPRLTQLASRLPVIAVIAVRTGAGKSPLSQAIARALVAAGIRTAILRHPMPYGNLLAQRAMRYARQADLDRYGCTIEEREEYQPYLESGLAVFAGVDYRAILEQAEREADAILWDGGNNDYPFIRPDLSILVMDALRAGDETRYYPGETNLRAADVLVLNKVSAASAGALATLRRHAAELNPRATVIEADLAVTIENPAALAGRRAIVVEDGPTLTHGGMAYGAGTVAASGAGAVILDPRNCAVGTIAEAYAAYPHIGKVVPALGYSPAQVAELAETIRRSGAEVVVDASPAGLAHVLAPGIPIVRVRYRFEQTAGPPIFELVARAIREHRARHPG
jgi:predicted GTPase